MKLILLGTAGGPRPSAHRAQPSQGIVHGGDIHIVDCGNGVARQTALAGLELRRLRTISVTHHHIDHVADVGCLPVLAWTAGLSGVIDILGPPPLRDTIDHFLRMVEPELEARTATTGRRPFEESIAVKEIDRAGVAFEAEGLTIRTALVNHPPFAHALAYRFDTNERSIVVSGDTTFSQALIELAEGADVLVHEAMYEPSLGPFMRSSNASTLREHLVGCHTTAEEAGAVAKRAGVRTLVLSHLVPWSTDVTDEMWMEAAATAFDGDIIVGEDLMEI